MISALDYVIVGTRKGEEQIANLSRPNRVMRPKGVTAESSAGEEIRETKKE